MPPTAVQLLLRQLEPGDTVTGLSLGDEKFTPLKTYLRRDAKSHHKLDLGKTYGFFEGPRARGYVTLVCGEIVVENGVPRVEDNANFKYPHFPAVKIARLAVDTRFRGENQRLGEKLVQFSLGIVKTHICPRVGCRFVVVDAKKDSVGFYVKQGFTPLDTPENLKRDSPIMFIDMTKVAAT